MNYSDIIKALPVEVVTDLQDNLDSVAVQAEAALSFGEATFLLGEAVKLTKLGDGFASITDAEKRRMVEMFLNMVPEAAAQVLFS